MQTFTLDEIAGYLEQIRNGASITRNSKEHLEHLLYDMFDVQVEIYREDIRITGKVWKTYKYPKKEITAEWIHSRFTMYEKYCDEYTSHYVNLCNVISRDLKFKNSFYIASYGIGIDNFYTQEEKQMIRDFLNEKKISYTETISRGGYVTRFNISKSKETLELLKTL